MAPSVERRGEDGSGLFGDDDLRNSNVQLSAALAQARLSNNDQSVLTKQTSLLKQNSLLHQSSSYLKQATSGFARWQSRRAFWSAADKDENERAERQPARVTCANAQLAVAYYFKTVGAVARKHPSVIIAPLLLFTACLAGGLVGVILAANKAENSRRNDAEAAAQQAAVTLELLIEDRALQPAAALASLIRQQPNMTAMEQALPRLAVRLLQPQSTAGAIREFLLSPFGIVAAVLVPSSTAGGSSGSASNSTAIVITDSGGSSGGSGYPSGGSLVLPGSNLQAAAATGQGLALATQVQAPVVTTVLGQAPGSNGGASEVLLVTHHPVYAPAASANETWGNTAAAELADCGADCYNASAGTKLWGFASSVVSLTTLLNTADSELESLKKLLSFTVSIRLSGSSELVEVAASKERLPPHQKAVTVSVGLTGSVAAGKAVAATATGGTEGEMSVYNTEGWQPVWEGPLIAVVVVVSVALAVMLFVMLFAYWRHVSMLKAMLPEKVIGVLGRGMHYYQHFDSVTVLYADVVRYTTATMQQGESVPTLEVVKMLNDVHTMYDSIIQKYGLVRIRRSGESFLCVGGCPTADDPVAVAVRVASCARDMVMATARFRGSGGFRVQIRMGLHSGPVVAAVVGSKMPRFSLFGDIVDVAYYMEATSRAMAIHVSEVTSQLLASANDPLLQLKSRGRLDIIGQGSMMTNWLRLEALPDPEVADEEDRNSAVKGVPAARPK